jgi:hypothetical protein
MAKPDLESTAPLSKNPSESNTGTGVNTPDLDPKTLKVQRKAIASTAQAWSVISKLLFDSNKRNEINAEISSRYNGKQPYDPKMLRDQGRDWESNFPTLFMAGLIDRIVPTLINSIDGARYLTQATLPEEIDGQIVQNREKKVETFRELITKYIRRWRGWRNFCASLCQEDVLIGYAFACWTDEDEWRPTFYRQDTAFVPEASPQFSEFFQVFAIKQPMLLHFLVDIIRDKKSAEDAGWDVDNCVNAINNALPQTRPSSADLAFGQSAREYEDIIRECNQGTSFMSGAKVVELRHLFAVEPDEVEGKGRISHYILDGVTTQLLFARDRRFDLMSDVVAPFTLEPGNGKFYGSKGAGRVLSNYSIAVDVAANDMLNQVKMAGMKILKTDAKSAINAQVRVKSPFCIITSDAPMEKEGFEVDIEASVGAIEQLTKMAEIAANAYIPNQISEDTGPRKTAREATIDYTRELQAKAAFVSRFSGQFAEMVNTIQKRICKSDTSDEEAKEFLQELKDEGLSEKEIELLSESEAMETVQDLTGITNQQRSAVAAKYMGNPMVDSKKLMEADITAMTDPQFAKDIMVPDANDPTIETEQVRQALMEHAAIQTGESMPVSPRDNDATHLKVHVGELKQAGVSLSKQDPATIDPQILDNINAAVIHSDAHIQSWAKKGAKPQQLAPYKQFIGMADQALKKLAMAQMQAAQKAKQVLAEHQQMQQQGAPGAQQEASAPQGVSEQPIWSEKVLTSWIGQYDKLPPNEKQRLEQLGGLSDATNATPPSPEIQPPVSPPGAPSPTTAPEPAQPTPTAPTTPNEPNV